MATSLGLHVAALLMAISEPPRRSKDPMIEVEVLPVRVEVPAPIPAPVLADPVPRGAEVVGRRRAPVISRLAVSRSQPSPTRASNPEAPAEHAPEAMAAPGPASAENVVVAKAAPSEGAGPHPSPVVPGPRVGAPKTVAPAVGDGLLAINPNDPHYQPTIPQPLRKPGVSFLSRLKFCVTTDGSVDKVTVVTSSEPSLDNAILEKARLYRFHPYFDQGRPIPFCFYREYRLSVRD